MAMRVSFQQPSGEVMVLEVTPEMTGWALKQQIKLRQPWDELTRGTTSAEIVLKTTNCWPMLQRYWTLELLKILL